MLWSFHGGLHLDDHKAPSCDAPTLPTLMPRHLFLPLQQHIGVPATPIVNVGDKVLKGEFIAHCGSKFTPHPHSAPIHAPTSGTVVAIEDHPVLHPSGLSATCVVIETDGKDQWRERHPIEDFLNTDREKLHHAIMKAGIVGLGGAGFPSHLKVAPNSIDTVIINGAECEPYITCDDHLMQHYAESVVQGARIVLHVIGHAKRCVIAIEDNKPKAIQAITDVVTQLGYQDLLEVLTIPTRYPTGGERQLIKVVTGKEVPLGQIPASVGVIMHNVATVAAVYRAVVKDAPMITRWVTLTGGAIKNAGNMAVLLGTPIRDLLQACDCDPDEVAQMLIGGPMMGMRVDNFDMPVIKTTNCILSYSHQEKQQQPQPAPCIRCGQCADVCPVNLLPQQLYWYAKAKNFNKLQDYQINACIECGCCAYVCPSSIPLVHYYRYAKAELRQQAVDKKEADIAKKRHEFKLFRIEREKEERKALHAAKKKAMLAKKKAAKDSGEKDDKQAIIQAALARAKAKKAQKQAQASSDSGKTA